MRKKWFIPALACTLMWIGTIPTFAGEWKQDDKGWWYQYENEAYSYMTGYPADKWVWIDRDGDNVAECYYFDENGYLVTNTTVHGLTVNENGAWHRTVPVDFVNSNFIYEDRVMTTTFDPQLKIQPIIDQRSLLIADNSTLQTIVLPNIPDGKNYSYTFDTLHNDDLQDMESWSNKIYSILEATYRFETADDYCGNSKPYREYDLYDKNDGSLVGKYLEHRYDSIDSCVIIVASYY